MIRYIGVDVGGTSLRTGAMNEEGALVYEKKVITCEGIDSGEGLVDRLLEQIRRIPSWEEAESVGVGIPGAVDPATGRVTVADNLILLNGLPLQKSLTESLGKPVAVDNDARVAALAEALQGAGAGMERVCYVTISTGLGGGFVERGRIYHGSGNMGSYLCRMILDGEHNCEELLSGTSLLKRLRETGSPGEKASDVFKRALVGDPAAQRIAAAFRQNLAVLFQNLAVTFDPDVIVAGGGVMNCADLFFDDAVDLFRQGAHPQQKNLSILRAKHREPGLIGACLLARGQRGPE